MTNNNIILIIRGHIRNSFNNQKLYDLLKKISENYNLSIYIHTWNIQQSNISWREIKQINNIITKEIIYEYFKDLNIFIKYIIIDDDTQIKLIGNLEGTIGPKCPKIGWKRYIYGLYKITNYVKNYYSNEFIANMRFDILENSNSITEHQILLLINNNHIYNNEFTKVIFLYNNLYYGLDNIFCGNIKVLYKLLKYFNENLDYIISRNKQIISQEFLLFIENELIF